MHYLSRFSILVLVSLSYLYLEWIFILSATSPLDLLPNFPGRLSVTFAVVLLTFSGLLAFLTIYFTFKVSFNLLSKNFPMRISPPWRLASVDVFGFLSAVILASLALLLVDNFVYTMFQVGISQSAGFSKIPYLCVLAGTFYAGLRLFAVEEAGEQKENPALGNQVTIVLALFFITISVTSNLVRLSKMPAGPETIVVTNGEQQRRPNIILFGMDGVDAKNMSLYGYDKQTTPFLDSLKNRMLIFENGIANAVQTTGATTALLTGRDPATTRVLYTPHILTGSAAYQHLPGILRNMGYTNVQETVGEYADGFDLNFRNAFSFVNGKERNPMLEATTSLLSFSDHETNFLHRLTHRINSRIKHLFNITQMRDPYGQVGMQDSHSHKDIDRVESVLNYIGDGTEAPYFIHFHFLDTHGCNPNTYRKFSPIPADGYDPHETENNEAACDQSILGEDAAIAQTMDQFEKLGLLEDAIIVIYSDHTSMGTVDRRIPIAFLDTTQDLGDSRKENAQLTDIAPTILSLIGQEVPDWMQGISLLDPLDARREIFSLGQMGRGEAVTPYGMRFYMLTVCQRQFTLDIRTNSAHVADIAGHTGSCNPNDLPDIQTAMQKILDKLLVSGFFGEP